MPRVIHFEIHADQPERAVQFYRDAFGWEINKWGPMDYWLCSTGPDTEPGIHGAITPRSEPRRTTVNTISVPSVDEYSAKVVAAGGLTLTPKEVIPGVGHFRYCQDSEGNVFGIMQPDPEAK
jgi:uncharacterized protein